MSKGRKSKKESREEIFCREYVIDLNGARAAIAAGYSKKTAHAAASRLLRNVKVQAKICELQKVVADKLDLDAEKVLGELSKIGFSDTEKTADKIRALELLGKHLKLFREVIEVSGLEGLAEKLVDARKRAA